MSISTIFPKAWKLATVIPIPKVNNPSGVSYYRPTSLLLLPEKLLEKLIHTQLITHLENKLLNEKQNGFRKNHYTSDTVFKLFHGLANNMNYEKFYHSCFCRLRKGS